MNRSESAANARWSKSQRRALAEAERSEILELRAKVGLEFGSAGLRINLGDIDEEYVPDLKRITGRIGIYDQMRNDPIVRGQLRAIKHTLIAGVRWTVEGGRPEHRKLVEANLFRRGPRRLWCEMSWINLLNQALSCLDYGFSMFAKTRDLVDDQYIFRKLRWLHPRTVREHDGWEMDDNDNLLAVHRDFRSPTGKQINDQAIPASEMFLLPWDALGPNWEGTALIRVLYKVWKLRSIAEKIDIIDLQNRGIAIPIAHLSGIGGPKEKAALTDMLKSVRGGSKEKAFFVIEKEGKIGYMTSEGQVKDAKPILDGKAMDAARAIGTQFFEQGNTDSGSRAAASSLGIPFYVGIDAIRILVEDLFNDGYGVMPGLVQDLVDMQGDPDVDEYPRIVGSRVSPTEQLDNIPIIGDLTQKGLLPPHIKIANEALRRLGWPEFSPKEFEEASRSRVAVPSGFGGGGSGRPNEHNDRPDSRDDEDSQKLVMARGEERRGRPLGESPRTRSAGSYPWV